MSRAGLDPLLRIQEIAPTERCGGAHTSIRQQIEASPWVGRVLVEQLLPERSTVLGEARICDGSKVARVIVSSDGLGGSGAPVFIPDILMLPEETPVQPQDTDTERVVFLAPLRGEVTLTVDF